MRKWVLLLQVGIFCITSSQVALAFSLEDAVKIGVSVLEKTAKQEPLKIQEKKPYNASEHSALMPRVYELNDRYKYLERLKHILLSSETHQTYHNLQSATEDGDVSLIKSQSTLLDRLLIPYEARLKHEQEQKRKKQLKAKKYVQQQKSNQKIAKKKILLTWNQEQKAYQNGLQTWLADYPYDQVAFTTAAIKGRLSVKEAKNELAIGSARTTRKHDLCNLYAVRKSDEIRYTQQQWNAFAITANPKLLRNFNHKNWIGRVVKLDSSHEGKGVLGIEIAHRVRLQTRTLSLGDSQSKTLIEPHTKLYNALLQLQVGDIVSFSGVTLPNTTDCHDELSLTLRGSMQSPVFLFKFIDINKIS